MYFPVRQSASDSSVMEVDLQRNGNITTREGLLEHVYHFSMEMCLLNFPLIFRNWNFIFLGAGSLKF